MAVLCTYRRLVSFAEFLDSNDRRPSSIFADYVSCRDPILIYEGEFYKNSKSKTTDDSTPT